MKLIKWNDKIDFGVYKQDMMVDKKLFDCAIYGQGYLIPVHRAVMKQVSLDFERILTSFDRLPPGQVSVTVPVPILMAPNVNKATMESILMLIYTGETVATDQQLVEMVLVSKTLNLRPLKNVTPEVSSWE